jgi:MFS family permease
VYGLGVLTLPSYALTLHASAVSIGVMFGAYSLAVLVFSPVFSRLSYAWGRIRTITIGCICLSLSTLLFAAANSLPTLILARGLQGIAASASFTPALALLTDSTAAGALGETLGSVTGWAGLGMLLGPPVGALLAAWKGYSLPFYFGAFTSLAMALLTCVVLEERERLSIDIHPISYRKLMPILGAIALGAGTLAMLEPIIPLLLRAKFSASQAEMGLIFALVVLVFGLMSPLAGKIADKAGRLPVLISGLLFLGSALPVLALPHSLYLVTVCLALVGAALALVLVPTLPELAEQARRQGLSAYEGIYALFNCSYAVGSIVGPVAGGVAVQAVGFQTGLLCFGVTLIVYSTGLGCGQNDQEKEKEAASLLTTV